VVEIIKVTEKILLILIGGATVFATGQELLLLFYSQKVELADLLLLFIYTEVLGMVGVFYKSQKIPITLPLFIAITALSRMIILQGKDSDPQNLIYESAAVLLLSFAILVIRHKSIADIFDYSKSKS
jgi:protein PsiE